jgi:aminoglycoside phosphotransferase (APT) family kinase protein
MIDDPSFQPFLDWAAEAVDGRVVRCERQGERRSGGRPAFFITFEREGEEIQTYARMDRGDGQLIGKAFGLDREYRVLVALGEQGIRVPKVYGLCETPRGILMENVAGDFDYTVVAPGPTRDALDRDFLEELARLHRIDIASWKSIGLNVPVTAEEIALGDLALWERTYHRGLRRPVPLVEFATRWLHRNVPSAPPRIALIQGDTGPGQFIFDGPKLKSIIDWEFAHFADPILDLAQIRTRDFYNPGGDMTAWMQTYADITGEAIDLPRLRYYTVKSMLITPLALAGVCQNMVPQTDHAEWYAQDVTYKRATAEALGEALGVELVDPAPPEPAASETDGIFDLLEQNLRDEHRPAAPDAYAQYRIDLALRLTTHLRNVQSIGAALERQEAEERAELLDAAIESDGASEAKLLERIERGRPEDDESLVVYLYRRSVRDEAVWRGALGVGEGAKLQPLRL